MVMSRMGASQEAPQVYKYRDFSKFPDPDPMRPIVPPDGNPNFPVKILRMLECEEVSHIVSWMPHGRSWMIHRPDEFRTQVIPAFFDHKNMLSFSRQTSGWGFRRFQGTGPDNGSFYHELFLRGRPDLTKIMKRVGPGPRAHLEPGNEPNFLQMPPVSSQDERVDHDDNERDQSPSRNDEVPPRPQGARRTHRHVVSMEHLNRGSRRSPNHYIHHGPRHNEEMAMHSSYPLKSDQSLLPPLPVLSLQGPMIPQAANPNFSGFVLTYVQNGESVYSKSLPHTAAVGLLNQPTGPPMLNHQQPFMGGGFVPPAPPSCFKNQTQTPLGTAPVPAPNTFLPLTEPVRMFEPAAAAAAAENVVSPIPSSRPTLTLNEDQTNGLVGDLPQEWWPLQDCAGPNC